MTTHTTPIDLREFHGRYVEATIEGITFKGKLSINSKGHVYICHNCFQLKRPNYIEEMFGYDYNYCAQLSGEEVCADSITYITILGESKPINPEWDWKDGEEVYLRGNKYKCHMLKDDLVCFASAATGVCRKLFTLKAAYNHGFRKLPPQQNKSKHRISSPSQRRDITRQSTQTALKRGWLFQAFGVFMFPPPRMRPECLSPALWPSPSFPLVRVAQSP